MLQASNGRPLVSTCPLEVLFAMKLCVGVLEGRSSSASFLGLLSLGKLPGSAVPQPHLVSLMSAGVSFPSPALRSLGLSHGLGQLRICAASSLLSDHAFFPWPRFTPALVTEAWERGLELGSSSTCLGDLGFLQIWCSFL